MTPPDSTLPEEDYLNKVSKQKAAYNELAQFEPGQGGLQYFPCLLYTSDAADD